MTPTQRTVRNENLVFVFHIWFIRVAMIVPIRRLAIANMLTQKGISVMKLKMCPIYR